MSLININTSEKEKQEEKSKEEETKSNAKIAIKKAQKVAAILLTAIGFDEYGGTLVYPFVPKMLKKRFHISKKNVGVLSGVIEGSFKASSFFSCFYLGYFSDKFGRKPIIIFSLFMVSITLLLFGFAWSVPLLIILQVIAGLTDGSEVVTKAVFSDLTSGVLNNYRSFLFAAMSACYAFFRGLSSATVSIFFGHDFGVESFKKNPYLFPCIIGAIIVFIVAIITYIFFSDKGLMPKEVEPFVHKFKNLKEGFKYVWANRLLRKLVIVFSLCDFSNGSVFVLMILYATLDYSEGGLGFSPNETGVIFIVFGIGTTIYELLWYNKLVKKIGVRKLFLLGSLVTAVCASMFPISRLIIGHLESHAIWKWVVFSIFILPYCFGMMSLLSNALTMISNASGPGNQGMIQGSAGSIGSLFRSLGPFLAGSYFSFAEYINFPALVFITLGFIYFIGFLLMLFIKSPELEKSSHFLLKENGTKEEDETNLEKDFLIKIDEKNSETNSERESLIKNDEHQNV